MYKHLHTAVRIYKEPRSESAGRKFVLFKFLFICQTSLQKDGNNLNFINLIAENCYLIRCFRNYSWHGPSFKGPRAVPGAERVLCKYSLKVSVTPYILILCYSSTKVFGFPYSFVRTLFISWLWTMCLLFMLNFVFYCPWFELLCAFQYNFKILIILLFSIPARIL